MYSHIAWLTSLSEDETRPGSPQERAVRTLAAWGDPVVQVVHAGGGPGSRGAVEALARRLERDGISARGLAVEGNAEAFVHGFRWTEGLVVMGRRQDRGPRLGRTMRAVLEQPGCPVLVVGGRPLEGLSSLLCAVDPALDLPLAQALELATEARVPLSVLGVLDVRSTLEPESLLETLQDQARRHLVHGTGPTLHFEVGIAESPGEGICAVAEEHSLVVMGSHARSGLLRLFLGSVAEHVAACSPVPTLVVRPRR